MRRYYFTQNEKDSCDQSFWKSWIYLHDDLESQYSYQGNSSIY